MCPHVQACNRQGILTVPLCTTHSESTLVSLLSRSSCSVLCCSSEELKRLVKAPPQGWAVQTLVVWGEPDAADMVRSCSALDSSLWWSRA